MYYLFTFVGALHIYIFFIYSTLTNKKRVGAR